jgi:parallel beta-helix repeat protein
MSSKTIVFFSVMALFLAGAEAATITVGSSGADHATIQGAIDAASPGDVVEVEAGRYGENLVVRTTITLRAAGDETRRPIVDGGGRGSALTILADGVEVEGLILENGGFGSSGIEVRSKDNLIRKNLVTDNRWYGIYLDGSTGTAIEENVVWNNKYGIWINVGSDENRIVGNVLEANENYNAFDLGKNIWDGNFFGDYDGSAPTYAVPGISSVDLSPSGPEMEYEAEDEPKEPLLEEEVEAESEDVAGDLASGSDELLSGEEPFEDIAAEGPAPRDPGSWSGQSLADLGLSLGGAHPEETVVDETDVEETDVEEVEEFAQGPAFGDAIVDFEVGEAAPEGPGGDEGDGEAVEDLKGAEEISVDAYAAEDWLRRGDALAEVGRYADALA